jgi:hypothetical protein
MVVGLVDNVLEVQQFWNLPLPGNAVHKIELWTMLSYLGSEN